MDDEPLTASDYFHRGVEYLERGRYEDALEAVNAAIERHYFGADIAMVKGEILFELSRYREALSWFKRASELDDGTKVEATLWRGRVFMEEGQLGRALSAFNRVIQMSPLPGMAYLHKGTVLVERGDFLLALEALEEAQALLSDNEERAAEVLYYQGRGYQGLKRLGEAVAHYERCLALETDYLDAYTELGELYRSTGRVEQAVEVYRRGLRVLDDEAVLYNELGNALRDLGHVEESISMLNRAIELGDVTSIAAFNRALSYERSHRWEEALRDYQLVLDDAASDTEARLRRLEIFSRLDRFDDAFLEHGRLTESERENSEVRQVYARFLNRYVRYLESQGNVSGMLDTYRKLLDLHPDLLSLENPGKQFASPRERHETVLELLDHVGLADPNADLVHLIKAPLLFSLRSEENEEELARAAEEAAREARKGPFPEVAELILAEVAFYSRHDSESALNALNRALAARDDYVAAMWLKVTVLLEGMRDVNGAIQTYNAILRHTPNNPAVLDALGQLYLEQGDPYRALICYRRLIGSAPGDVAIQRELASCYLALGRISEAVDELRRLSARNPQDLELKLDIVDALIRAGSQNEAADLLGEVESQNAHLNPSVDDACAELRALLLNQQRRFSQAMAALNDVPDDELSDLGLLQRGIAGAADDDTRDQAMDDFLRVISEVSEQHPIGRRAKIELAKLERVCGRPEEAERLLEEVIESNPFQWRVRALLVWVLRELGREDEASRAEVQMNAYRELDHGRRLLLNEEFEDAADELRALAGRHPNFAEAYYWLAAALCRCGYYKAATAQLSEAGTLGSGMIARAKTDPFFEGFAFSEL